MKNALLHTFVALFIIVNLLPSCEIVDNDPDKHAHKNDSSYVGLEDVADILTHLPLSFTQIREVYDAVTSSSDNGYDEEYTMQDLFEAPGRGVGDVTTKNNCSYEEPLRDLIRDFIHSGFQTKSDASIVSDPEAFLEALENSGIQIYWPFSENWNGEDMPIITYDPEDNSVLYFGYKFVDEDDGFRRVEEVLVDEEMAKEVPVWVINRNSDAGYNSLELLRRNDPDWGEGGGNIIVKPLAESTSKCLVLKDFTMKRNYDSWFAGASEFFVKIGYMEDFTASTEAELRLYNPMITDFMIVVKRKQVGVPQNINAILMTDWSENADACAFMITEDDGGTQENWSAKAKVYVSGKSYGVEINLPLNRRDDIVWRGLLSYNWINKCHGQSWPFGDVELTFELMEY